MASTPGVMASPLFSPLLAQSRCRFAFAVENEQLMFHPTNSFLTARKVRKVYCAFLKLIVESHVENIAKIIRVI